MLRRKNSEAEKADQLHSGFVNWRELGKRWRHEKGSYPVSCSTGLVWLDPYRRNQSEASTFLMNSIPTRPLAPHTYFPIRFPC